jgi:phage protein D
MWFENLKTGVPVKFSWYQGHLSKTWYGYVSFISKTIATQKINMMEVYCIGSSFVLKENAVRVFSNKTITEVVQQIASEFGLNFIGENDNRKFDQLVIAGHSYWEWITEHANKIGYGVYVEGTNLVFRPLDKLIDLTISESPILDWNNPYTTLESENDGKTLEYFKILNGEFIESDVSRKIKVVAGVDPTTAVISYSNSDPKGVGTKLRSNTSDVYFSEYRSDQVAHTGLDTQSASEGSAHLARFNLPAFAKGKGDPRFKPYSTVYVQNTGSLTDGYWVVKEVRHKFTRNKLYEADLSLVTDGTGINETSTFRQAKPDLIGIVNVDQIVSLDALTLRTDTTKLYQNGTTVNQNGQGFNRTPARWITTLKGYN